MKTLVNRYRLDGCNFFVYPNHMEKLLECLAIAGLIFMFKAIMIPTFGEPAVWATLGLSVALIANAYAGIRICIGSLRR